MKSTPRGCSSTDDDTPMICRRRALGFGAAVGLASLYASGRGVRRAAAAENQPRRPFPAHTDYAPDTIRPNLRSQARLDDDVRAAYERWKTRYLITAGSDDEGRPLYRVALGRPGGDNHAITVSEGQGYGLVIAAHMAGSDPAARELCDGLWRFARAHPSGIDPRLMTWHVPIGDSGNASAFDGDADLAFGLLLADAQWGSDGDIDYRAAATELLAGIAASMIGPNSRLPLLGDWVDPEGEPYNEWTTRTSDLMPSHFRAFGQATGDPLWSEVVAAGQRLVSAIQASASPETGLPPDFVQPVSAADHAPRPADPGFLEGPNDGAYGYNAGRVPWRLGSDALLHGDATSLRQARTISRWAEAATGGDPARLRAGYALDGAPLPNSDYFTSFFAAPLAVAAMLDPARQTWLNDLYDAVYEREEDYYEDSVTLLCLLALTGNAWTSGRDEN